jgi:cell division protein FtsL
MQMDNSQILTIALAAVPNMLAVLVGILINNARLSDTNARIGELRAHIDARFNDVDRRFDEMRDLWRSELYRVEQVLDARLKHLEERG